MKQEIIEAIEQNKLVAIMRGLDPKICARTAEALYEGGIKLVEVTFDQKNILQAAQGTLDAITAIHEALKGRAWVGAGTVTNVDLVKRAREAGASFIISPDTNPEVIHAANELGMVSIPGALSPTEIQAAQSAGADFVKVFPAAPLGAEYIKAVRAPLNHVKFLAVGGIDQTNMDEFLRAGVSGFGIGGCLIKQQWVEEENFEAITRLAGEFCRVLNG